MTRAEALQWLRERFRPELFETDPEWVETMIEITMLRAPIAAEDLRRSPLETVGGGT